MKNLQKRNITYRILKLQVAIFENNERERICIKKHGYGERAKKILHISRDLNKELDAIRHDLELQYYCLELNSKNLQELERLQSILLNFKEYDDSFLHRVKAKMNELNEKKEQSTKRLAFKEASLARDESHLLLEYYNKNKHYLKEVKLSHSSEIRVPRFKIVK